MNNTYLKQFCIALSSDNELSTVSFMNLYENSITHFTPYLKAEIQENILSLETSKHKYYLDYVISEIERTPFFYYTIDQFEKVLFQYDKSMSASSFPYFNGSLSKDLSRLSSNLYYDELSNSNCEFIQQNAFAYASMLEAKKMIEFVESENSKLEKPNNTFEKIKWNGKPSQLGFIIGMLTNLDYIDAPKRKTNDINYSLFAKQIKEVFEVKTTEGSLSKYLNLDSEKGQETLRKFEKENFSIPHKNIIS